AASTIRARWTSSTAGCSKRSTTAARSTSCRTSCTARTRSGCPSVRRRRSDATARRRGNGSRRRREAFRESQAWRSRGPHLRPLFCLLLVGGGRQSFHAAVTLLLARARLVDTHPAHQRQ